MAQRRTDIPILFSGPMVRALLDGRKTETRRIVKPQPRPFMVIEDGVKRECEVALEQMEDDPAPRIRLGRVITRQAVRHAPGDFLWVRETFARVGDNEDDIHCCPDLRVHAYYRADATCPEHLRWRVSIHMPRYFSRLTLRVRAVRVERLQEITSAAAIAEGCQPHANSQTIDCDTPDPRDDFRDLWNSLHPRDHTWADNPWVTVTQFEVIRGNIDSILAGA